MGLHVGPRFPCLTNTFPRWGFSQFFPLCRALPVPSEHTSHVVAMTSRGGIVKADKRELRPELLIQPWWFICPLDFLVFYDLLHLPMNSKWFADGSGLHHISGQRRFFLALSSYSTTRDEISTNTKGYVGQFMEWKIIWRKRTEYFAWLASESFKNI